MRGIPAIIGLGLIGFAAVAAGSTSQPSAPAGSSPQHAAEPDPRLAELIRSRDAAGVAASIDAATGESLEKIASMLASAAPTGLAADPLVIRSLAVRMPDANAGARAQILRVLARTSRREAVAAAIGALDQIGTLNDSDAVFRTLVAQTGRADLGADPDAWRRWWAEIEWIPEAEWLRRVAGWQAERAGQLETRLTRADRRLADLARAQYSLTPDAERPAFLLTLIGDELGTLRGVGLDLATRAVLDARPLPDELFNAVAARLREDAAGNRARAARLIAAAGIDRFGSALSDAIELERDHAAAAAILDALAISSPPGPFSAASASWLNHPPTAPSAARALLRAIDTGAELDPETLELARGVIEPDAGVSLGSAGVALFGRLSSDESFLRLAPLLTHDDAGVRNAAGAALAGRAAGLPALLEACRAEPGFFLHAARAITAHNPTAAGWTDLSGIIGAPDESLRLVIAALTDSEALTAAQAEPDPSRVLMLLDRPVFTEVAADAADAPSNPDTPTSLRVRALFSLGRDTDAVAAAERWSPEVWRKEIGFDPAAAGRLSMGEIDAAAARNPGAYEWIAALERTLRTDPDRCRSLVQTTKSSVGAEFSDAQRQRIDAIEQQLNRPAQAEPADPKNTEAKARQDG